jgi:hypothetical protein
MKHALLLLAVIATQAQAQIIYTDVDPDSTYSGANDTCSLDLDNDGNIDFLIVQRTSYEPCPSNCDPSSTRPRSWVKIDPAGTNGVAITSSYASQIPQGVAIDPALTWTSTIRALTTQDPPICYSFDGQPLQCSSGMANGNWLFGDSEDLPKFLGLRFESAGSAHYGWARLSIPVFGTSCTLKDYAYNSVPGEAIVAGDDGTTGITSIALRGMQVTPNPFSSTLRISLMTGTTGSVSYRVLSLMGQPLITRTIAPTSGTTAITIDLASLAPGTYLLEIETGGERMVRKVMKL